MKTKESIFQVGDKVYDFRFGWGKVVMLSSTDNYPIRVQFVDDYSTYTSEGFLNKSDKYPTLSFTKYDFISGGFSQVRPRPEIEVDTLVYVRQEGMPWQMRYFSDFDEKGRVFCFEYQLKSTETGSVILWKEYSLTNPLI